jgi:hypothetical protein
MKRKAEEPETLVGNCCGCHKHDTLYKVPGIYRYRCDPCFLKETGFRHHLAPLHNRIVLP